MTVALRAYQEMSDKLATKSFQMASKTGVYKHQIRKFGTNMKALKEVQLWKSEIMTFQNRLEGSESAFECCVSFNFRY